MSKRQSTSRCGVYATHALTEERVAEMGCALHSITVHVYHTESAK